jgi:hypothetical protein
MSLGWSKGAGKPAGWFGIHDKADSQARRTVGAYQPIADPSGDAIPRQPKSESSLPSRPNASKASTT